MVTAHNMTGEDRSLRDAPSDAPLPPPVPPRVLLVTDRLPGVDSGYGLRVGNVVRGLGAVGRLDVLVLDSSRRGERYPDDLPGRVTVMRAEPASRPAKLVRVFGRRPTAIRFANHRQVDRAVRDATTGLRWDLVWYSRAAAYAYAGAVEAPRRIVDLDDLNDRLLRTKIRDRRAQRGALRTLPRALWDRVDVRRWTQLQSTIAGRVDRVVVCSEDDRTRLGRDNCVVVPNGYPEPGPTASAAAGDAVPPRLLFVGPLTYEPNLFAVEWLVRAVVPLVRARVPAAELVVVGDYEGVPIGGLQAEGVSFAGWVPDVAPYYERAGVAVTPLHSGGGTRLKVMEAMARRVPLVSTPFGCEGLDLVDGQELLIAEDPEAFADACADVLTDAALGRRLTAAGRERYVRDMSSAGCSAAVTRLAQDTLAGTRRRGAGRAAAPRLPPGAP